MYLIHFLRVILELVPLSVLRHAFKGHGSDPYAPALAGPGTNLVLEGFPRSANTFCYYYLQLAFPSAKFAHHIHSWQQFLLAWLFRVPSFLIVRHPDDAVSSLMTKRPRLSVAICYLDYALFNAIAAIFAERVVLFEDVIDERFLSSLAHEVHERSKLQHRTVHMSEVRKLMKERTAHKNRATTPLDLERLNFAARLWRNVALHTYSQIRSKDLKQINA